MNNSNSGGPGMMNRPELPLKFVPIIFLPVFDYHQNVKLLLVFDYNENSRHWDTE